MNTQQKGEINRDGNIIYLKGAMTAYNLRFLCSKLYRMISKHRYLDVTLDFSLCDFVAEAFMLPALPLIVSYREKDQVGFTLILPEKGELQRLFRNTNWAHYINPEKFEKSDYEGGHLPALQYQDNTGQFELVNGVMELVLGSIDDWERGQLKAFEWSLNEITDNVLQHADSPVGGFVQATAFKEKREIEFVVADCGIGIPRSLNMEKTPENALNAAIVEGVTRNSDSNAGNGLFGSYQVAFLSKGLFEINSGAAHLIAGHGDGKVSVGVDKIPYDGTSVRCRIGFDNPNLLEEALRFGGQPHDPVDYIERVYESEETDDMIFKLAHHIKEVGSREGGKTVRKRLEGLLNNAPRVTVDFEGVTVISSSFADEVFGRLFVNLRPRGFTKRIVILNADRTTDVLIDRAILQRAKQSQNGHQS